MRERRPGGRHWRRLVPRRRWGIGGRRHNTRFWFLVVVYDFWAFCSHLLNILHHNLLFGILTTILEMNFQTFLNSKNLIMVYCMIVYECTVNACIFLLPLSAVVISFGLLFPSFGSVRARLYAYLFLLVSRNNINNNNINKTTSSNYFCCEVFTVVSIEIWWLHFSHHILKF